MGDRKSLAEKMLGIPGVAVCDIRGGPGGRLDAMQISPSASVTEVTRLASEDLDGRATQRVVTGRSTRYVEGADGGTDIRPRPLQPGPKKQSKNPLDNGLAWGQRC